MNRNRLILTIAMLAAGCLWSAGLRTYAQDQQPSGETPKPPAKAYGPLGVDDQQDQTPAPETLQPDTHPLTGIVQPTVGTPIERHSYWVPGVSYYNFIQSNGSYGGGGSSWTSTSYLSGSFSLLKNWSRSQLSMSYSGGGNFSTDSLIGNGWFQQVSATQTFTWERTQLMLLDDFAYLPQSQFGFGVGTGLSLPGIGGSLGGSVTGLGTGFSPGQSIFSAVGPRYTNTAGIQLNYQVTRRTSVTLSGLDSILRFSDAGNVESNDYVGAAGLNYQVSKTDTLGILYRYSAYHYIGVPQAIGDQMIQAAYGRKITGRLALQLMAGPEITNFRTATAPVTKTRYVNASGGASLTYAFQRGSVTGSYFHGVTAGSGVFVGATTDQFTGSVQRSLTRVWRGDAHVGFARNRSVQGASGLPNTLYDTFFGGAAAARPLGRNANVSLGYTAYIEKGNNSANFTTHQISVGLNWHTRPFVLR